MSRIPSLNPAGILTGSFLLKRKNAAKWIWLTKLLQDDINIIMANMLVGFFITILSFSTAIFSQLFIDELLPSGNRNQFMMGFILLFLTLIIRSGLTYFRRQLLFSQNKRINSKVLPAFLGLTLQLPKSFFDDHSTAELLSRLHEHKGLQKIIFHITNTLFMDLLLIFSAAVFLAWYSLPVSAALFIGISIFFFVTLNFTKSARAQQIALKNADQANQEQYLSLFQSIEAIKSHNAEDHFMARTEETQLTSRQKKSDLSQSKHGSVIIADLLTVSFSLLITGLSYLLVARHELKTGEMMAIIITGVSIIPAIYRSSQIRLPLEKLAQIVESMHAFSTLEKEYPEQEKEELQYINFQSLYVKNLRFSFPDCSTILKDISFRVSSGESIALLGESGSGKSTIFAILQKLYTPQSGLITINEQSITHIATPSLRNIMAIVPQEVKIFNGTLLDNIAVGSPHASPSSIIDFCLNTGLQHFFQSLPQGYLTQIGEGKVKLSSGQKQLVGIARALYRRPQLLLLDEVTAFMDSNMEKFTLQLLARFKRNMAIILITHKTETTRLADRIYVIKDGHIQDPHPVLFHKN